MNEDIFNIHPDDTVTVVADHRYARQTSIERSATGQVAPPDANARGFDYLLFNHQFDGLRLHRCAWFMLGHDERQVNAANWLIRNGGDVEYVDSEFIQRTQFATSTNPALEHMIYPSMTAIGMTAVMQKKADVLVILGGSISLVPLAQAAQAQGSRVIGVMAEHDHSPALRHAVNEVIILNKTPFYAPRSVIQARNEKWENMSGDGPTVAAVAA